MPRPTPGPVPAALLALAVVLCLAGIAGCAVGPSQRPAVATRQTDVPLVPDTGADTPSAAPAPPLLPPLTPTNPVGIVFTDCTGPALDAAGGPAAAAGRDLRVGCASLPVAGTGSAPSGEVGIVRVTLGPVPAGGAVPIAVLGDPGTRSGGEQALRLAARAPLPLLGGTALYGIDARGSGTGESVDCLTPNTRAALDDTDPAAADPVALAPTARAATTAARTCSQILEDSVTDYRTGSSADDLEQVRRALGASKLSTVALGTGAGVVADWAQRYPGGVGRTVLDALPDPTSPLLLRADQEAEAARAALAAFSTDCAARPDCPLGADPTGAVTRVLAALHAAPLPGADARTVTAGTAVAVLVAGLSDPTTWPATAAALAAAGRGDPGPVQAAVEAHEADGSGFDLALMTRCNDSSDRPTVDQVAQSAARARAVDPVFGSWFAAQVLGCSSWPVPTDSPALPTSLGVPPLLLASSADPRTPLPATQRVAAGLDGATLVSWLGAGHGAYPLTPCVDDAVDGYLLGAVIPRQGTVCPP